MSFQRLEAKRKLSDEADQEPSKIEPNSNYKDKYVHLIGHEAELEAARRTETNKSYGFGVRRLQIEKCWLNRNNILILFSHFAVPSANKKDMRTIENIQADIQAKKKQRLMQTAPHDADAGAGTSREGN